MPTLRAAALGLVAVLALSACSDDGPDAGDPMSTWTPSGTIEKPSETPTEKPTEPALPNAATKATEAGARAFITHYWDLINYAQATGDVKSLRDVSGPNCEGCAAGVEGIRSLYRDGGRLIGGTYSVDIVKINELPSKNLDRFAVEAKLVVRTSQQRVVQSDGTETVNRAGQSDVVVAAIWLGDAWRLEVMALS